MLARAASKRGTIRSNDNANPKDDPPSSWFRINGLGSACENEDRFEIGLNLECGVVLQCTQATMHARTFK